MSPRPPEVPAPVPSLEDLQSYPPESKRATTPQRTKVLTQKCSSFSFLGLCHSLGFIFPCGHNFIFMTGNYKIYKIWPKYQSLKDLWFYFLPIIGSLSTCHHTFTEILPKPRCQCSTKHYISRHMHSWNGKGASDRWASHLLSTGFSATGKGPPFCIIASRTWMSHILLLIHWKKIQFVYLRVWRICKAYKLESESWGLA